MGSTTGANDQGEKYTTGAKTLVEKAHNNRLAINTSNDCYSQTAEATTIRFEDETQNDEDYTRNFI